VMLSTNNIRSSLQPRGFGTLKPHWTRMYASTVSVGKPLTDEDLQTADEAYDARQEYIDTAPLVSKGYHAMTGSQSDNI
jgi:hypothetical protein